MARTSAKIAISLDASLLDAVGKVQRSTGETRSAVLARAVRLLVQADERRQQIAGYVEGYRRLPESAAETRAARTAAVRSLARLAWDDD